MKKVLALTTIGVVLPILVFAQAAPAQNQGAIGGLPTATVPDTIPLGDIITRVVNFAFGILIVIAGLMIFYSAYLYLFAGQTPDNTKKAKSLIIYALIALVVAFAARAIVSVFRGLIGF